MATTDKTSRSPERATMTPRECKAHHRRLRIYRLLAAEPASELRNKPLDSLLPLKEAGHAEVSHAWNEIHNGKTWLCQKVSITEAGRAEFARLEAMNVPKR